MNNELDGLTNDETEGHPKISEIIKERMRKIVDNAPDVKFRPIDEERVKNLKAQVKKKKKISQKEKNLDKTKKKERRRLSSQ